LVSFWRFSITVVSVSSIPPATGHWPLFSRHFGCGRWAFLEVTNPYDDVAETIRAIAGPQTASTGT